MKFKDFSLTQEMVSTLDALGYKQPTPIQEKTIPLILDKKDIIAQAKTGSGKTAAFGIGILSLLNVKKFYVQSLVLCPTRELAIQVAKELRLIAKFQHNIKILLLIGGESFYKQENSLAHQAHIVVGTPGRVLKHLNKENLDVSKLQTLVLDEADRMLDMGFLEEVESIFSFTPKNKQTLLFSATYDDEILAISHTLQQNTISIKTTQIETQNKIQEYFIATSKKEESIIKILSKYQPKSVIVFANTKKKTKELADELQRKNIDALALHGDLEQYERNDVLVQFSNHSCSVLVATDVAARGLDIKEVDMVINYDIPNQLATYTHRIGRTARAGESGVAVTLYLFDEQEKIQEYQNQERYFLKDEDVEGDMDYTLQSQYITLVIEGGKKDKLRPGDILGALTGDVGLDGDGIGKIDIYERQTYVAIKKELIDEAYDGLLYGKIKRKKFNVWIL
ncbi:ATP-dependent 23S rRNA helicase DbpA [hydrothermal vent metagenome]|uniref:ATP-dependent 23S rRNA helicase DbpA n=1 Tax=hydrothermal vent metagenome TaxID=652676 RepID=A0A1W1D5S7_9ZZZZ